MIIYSSNGDTRCAVKKFTYHDTFMGECFLDISTESPFPIDFEVGDYCDYHGERFYLNYVPAKEKKASKNSTGDAFKYDSIKMNSAADELTRCGFKDIIPADWNMVWTGLPNFNFYAQTAQDLADRIQANLDAMYSGDQKWTINVVTANLVDYNGIKCSVSGNSPIDAAISISGKTCMEALAEFYNTFKLTYIIRGRVITVAPTGVKLGSDAFQFKYGKGNGLYDLQQQTKQDALLITRLYVYGSTRNIGNHYYADLTGKAKATIKESATSSRCVFSVTFSGSQILPGDKYDYLEYEIVLNGTDYHLFNSSSSLNAEQIVSWMSTQSFGDWIVTADGSTIVFTAHDNEDKTGNFGVQVTYDGMPGPNTKPTYTTSKNSGNIAMATFSFSGSSSAHFLYAFQLCNNIYNMQNTEALSSGNAFADWVASNSAFANNLLWTISHTTGSNDITIVSKTDGYKGLFSLTSYYEQGYSVTFKITLKGTSINKYKVTLGGEVFEAYGTTETALGHDYDIADFLATKTYTGWTVSHESGSNEITFTSTTTGIKSDFALDKASAKDNSTVTADITSPVTEITSSIANPNYGILPYEEISGSYFYINLSFEYGASYYKEKTTIHSDTEYKVTLEVSGISVTGYIFLDAGTNIMARVYPSETNYTAFKNAVTASSTIYITDGIYLDLLSYEYVDYDDILPANLAVNYLMLPDFPLVHNNPNDVYLEDADAIAKYGVREGTVVFDGSDTSHPEVYPTIHQMTAKEVEDAGVSLSLDPDEGTDLSLIRLDEIKSSAMPTDSTKDGDIPVATDSNYNNWQKTFVVYLKDLGFDLTFMTGENKFYYATSDKMQISMISGACTGRSFDITNIEKDTTLGYLRYKLTCNRQQDSDVNKVFPYDNYPIAIGDQFVLLNIRLPRVYIEAAAQKLKVYGLAFLNNNNKTKYTYIPKVDEIWMANNPSVSNVIKAGDLFDFSDIDLNLSEKIFIKTLSISEGTNIIPSYDITLDDETNSTTLEKIQNQIDNISVIGAVSTVTSGTSTPSTVAESLDPDSSDWEKILRKDKDQVSNFGYTFASVTSPSGTFNKLIVTNLTDGHIPYISDTVLSDSPLLTDGINLSTLGTITSPSFVGDLTGNAATATKLQTPRTIWGQSFDGTGDVGGELFINNGIIRGEKGTQSLDGIPFHGVIMGHQGYNSCNFGEYGGKYNFYLSTDPTTNASLIARIDTNNNYLSGSLGLGTVTPAYKLDVNGTLHAAGAVTLSSTLTAAGLITANGGTNTTTLTATALSTLSATNILGDAQLSARVMSPDYVSQTKGWGITRAGAADFRNLYADELRVQAFTADISQALAGSDYLTKSVSKLSANFVVPAVNSTVRIIVDDIEGMPATQCFTNGDYIRFRAFNRTSGLTIANVWGTVILDTTYGTNGFSNGTQAYTFTCTQTTGTGLTVFKGSEVLDYGTSGSGLISRTTLDAIGSPYEQIATWINDPSNGNNYTVHARLGNLNGIANCSGYGLFTDNGFFTGKVTVGDLTKSNHYLDFSNGALTVKGNVYLASGYAAVSTFDMDHGISLAVDNIQIGGRNLFGYNKGIGPEYAPAFGFDKDNNGFWFDTQQAGICLRLSNLGFNGIGGTFTVSGYIKASSTTKDCYLNLCDYGPVTNALVPITTSYTYFERTYENVQSYITPDNYNGFLDFENLTPGVRIYLKDFKIERGNKATTYTPAPEDVDAAINLKVSKDGVIGAINLTSEAATIQASKINLVGAVTIGAIDKSSVTPAALGAVSTDGSNAPDSLENSKITVSSNGTLNGAGGGQVTITGLGYTGALDATKGAPNGTYVGGTLAQTVESNAVNALSNAAKAQSTADGKITTFYQKSAPTTGMSDGDIWFDTDDNNKIYIYQSNSWTLARDSGIAQAINAASAAQTTANTGVSNAATAQTTANNAATAASTAQTTANKKVETYFSTTQPTATTVGDLWYNTATALLKRWNGSDWETVSNGYDNTNQLSDGANLGGTATWNGVTGTGKPADNATVGATWGTDLLKIPSELGKPSAAGLYLTGDSMGYWDGSAFKTYMDKYGNMVLGNPSTAKGLSWNQETGDLVISGDITITGGSTYNKLTYITSDGIYTGTITANQVNAVAINASSITTGTLSADRIDTNSLNGNKIISHTITTDQIDTSVLKVGNISGAASTTDLATAISNIEVGGRNYILNSDFSKGGQIGWGIDINNAYLGIDSIDTFMTHNVMKFSGDTNVPQICISETISSNKLKPNTEYTLSCYAWMKNAIRTGILGLFVEGNKSSGTTYSDLTGGTLDWQRFTIKFTTAATLSDNYVVGWYFCTSTPQTGTIRLGLFHLEEGNMVTDWTPAPEDTDTSISETAARNDTMAQKLGYADYNAMVAGATLGGTLIVGGYLNTDLINAKAIVTTGLQTNTIDAKSATIQYLIMTNATVTGNITATTGAVGPFGIDAYELQATNGNDSLLLNADLIRFKKTNSTEAYIGGDVLPPFFEANLECPARFEVSRAASIGEGNAGLILDVTGATLYDDMVNSGNHALYITHGDIQGARLYTTRSSASKTLTTMDSVVIDISSSSDSTYTFPSGCEGGQMYILITTNRAIYIKPSGSDVIRFSDDDHLYTSSESKNIVGNNLLICVYDSANNRWLCHDVRQS